MESKPTSPTQSGLGFTTSGFALDDTVKITISVEGVEYDTSDVGFIEGVRDAIIKRYQKREDYNRGNITYLDYFPFGEASAVHNLFCKSQRLVSVVRHARSDGTRDPNNESIDDAYIDIAVHALFGYARRRIVGGGEAATPGTPPPGYVNTPRGPRRLGEIE